ncbi:hypothetical protein [Limnohabitans sp.]|uniref:hypothetical protein n=1 Tax=Limnohabitans sp. TaxID=1907725 RepID=UPI00289780EA|nr:hypothetical protein [Limnohabitans sp.]
MEITSHSSRRFFKPPFLFLVSVLSACSHTVTMYPRGGGEVGSGSLNDGTREIQVLLKGKRYTGKFVRNQTYGFALGQTFGSAPSGAVLKPGFGTTATMGASNQATAVLVSGSDVLRCDLVVVNASDGSGVCTDSNNLAYDVLIK